MSGSMNVLSNMCSFYTYSDFSDMQVTNQTKTKNEMRQNGTAQQRAVVPRQKEEENITAVAQVLPFRKVLFAM